MNESKLDRIDVLLDRMREGVASGKDATELCALFDGQIEEIVVGLPAAWAEEENEG